VINIEAMPDIMGYDRAIVTFSPDGRLFQVEYAREAVKRGSTCLGLIFDKGVVLTATRQITELGIVGVGSDKIHQIDDHVGTALCGFLADGRALVDMGRVKAQVFKLTYDEAIDVTGVAKEISDRMQLFTQYGGVRPYGVSVLLGGTDEKGPRLYEIDPSSAFFNWKAHAIGRGSPEAIKVLKKNWKSNMSEDDAIRLALQALKAGEKGVKVVEVELTVINSSGYKKYYGENNAKFIKKFW
jgi:proteasome alpha subunit